jgi:4-hydroxy-tetrahydrodipicolinate reductase
MNRFPEYEVKLSEVHHVHKKDAPSGTAITLAEDILKELTEKPGGKMSLQEILILLELFPKEPEKYRELML